MPPRPFPEIATAYARALERCLGDDLVSVVLFGSIARGEDEGHTDIDLLIVARNLPQSFFARSDLLAPAREAVAPDLAAWREAGRFVSLSEVILTPEEARPTRPLYLDLTEDAVMLFDRDDFFRRILDALRARLRELGARRIVREGFRYWDLKPDYRPGEIFSI